MDTKPLASFAINTRLKMIQSSNSRIEQALMEDSRERLEKPQTIALLEQEIKAKGIEQVVSEISYLWFNRFLALTMLDAIGFNSPSVLSPLSGAVYPEILQEAKAGRLHGLALSSDSTSRVQGLLSGMIPSANSDAEVYALLIQEVCKSWGDRFPMIFQAGSDVAEMLAPSDLLSLDSIRSDFIRVITGDYAIDVETIGWLFQFYNSEVKDSAFAKFKAGKKATHQDLVAATQIFTPRAIAQSMVENTLGSIWARMHPNSSLAIALPAVARLDSECSEVSPPEKLTVLDPAVGSGNLLLSAYDYLERIYSESGYNTVSIPGLILEHNLHGIDIDPRAASLASFALWLRAARALNKAMALGLPQPKINVLQDTEILIDIAQGCKDLGTKKRITSLASAGTIGSLVQVKDTDIEFLRTEAGSGGLPSGILERVVKDVSPLTQKYSVVLANPPYMGPKNMPPRLKSLIEEDFSEGKADLYGAFLIRAFDLIGTNGRVGLITQASWLNLQRFETLRRWFCRFARDSRFIRTDPQVFFGIGSFVDKALTFFGSSGSNLSKDQGFSQSTGRLGNHELLKFEAIQGMPFAFGLPDHLLDAFYHAPRVGEIVKSTIGAKTGENAVFLRYWWEVEAKKIERTAFTSDEAAQSEKKWFPFTKGGAPKKWYGNMIHVVDWANNGNRFKNGLKANGAKRNFQTAPVDIAFRSYICWSDISASPAFRFTPSGFMPGFTSPAVVAQDMFGVLAFLNSAAASRLIKILNPTIHIQIGDVENIPMLLETKALGPLGESAVKVSELLWNDQEISMTFDAEAHIRRMSTGLHPYSEALDRIYSEARAELEHLQETIDGLVSPAYGYPWGGVELAHVETVDAMDLANGDDGDSEPDEDIPEGQAGRHFQALSLIMGLMTGRYDAPRNINLIADADNIIPLMAENYFEDDFSSRLPGVLDLVTDGHTTESLDWLTFRLGMPLRNFLRKEFYGYHLKAFRGCPIYWVIRSPKGTFQAITYIHRFSVDTLATCRSKYVQPLIDKFRTQQKALQSIDPKKAAALENDIKDLQELDNRLYELVLNPPLIDFDEGVAMNHARFATVLQKLK